MIDASLAAVEFYQAHGFEETGRGDHRLRSGRRMPCVFMRKTPPSGDQTDIERSNGYESAASEFIARRRTEIGVATLVRGRRLFDRAGRFSISAAVTAIPFPRP